MRMLGEMGVLGLIIFVVFLWKCWKLGWDTTNASRGPSTASSGRDRRGHARDGALVRVRRPVLLDPHHGSVWMLCALASDRLLERRAEAA